MKRILLMPLIVLATAVQAQNVKVVNPDTLPVPVKVISGGGGGGGSTPGGSTTQLQYNNAGVIGGITGVTYTGLAGTINLGVVGTTLGQIQFFNTTSGNLYLRPVSGALGTDSVMNIPIEANGTLATRAYINGTPQIASIELNDPADTTISRVSAGKIAVEGVPVSLVAPRVTSTGTNSAPAPNADTTDLYILTALTDATATFAAPTGTPAQGQKLMIRITDSGGPRTLAWNSGTGGYSASTDLALPLTTTASKTMYLMFVYNATGTAKWNLLAKLDNF